MDPAEGEARKRGRDKAHKAQRVGLESGEEGWGRAE